jgi:D-amino-acid dehydrogenase
MTTKQVTIIGAGVTGLCSAYELLRRGCSVTVVERGGPDHDSCSLGNAGMIVPSHFEPLAAPGVIATGLGWLFDPEAPLGIRPGLDLGLVSWLLRFWRAATAEHVARCSPVLRDLHLRSRELTLAYAAAHGNSFDLEALGMLVLCKSQQALDHEARLALRAEGLGVPAQVLDSRGVAEAEPNATLDVAGGVLFPKDAHLAPHRFVASLTRRVSELGGQFVWNAGVTNFRLEGARVRAAVISAGEIAADEFVLAAGAWSPAVSATLGLSLPMCAGKGYSLSLDAPKQRPKLCSLLAEARVAVTPMGRGLRVGGTLQIGTNDLSVDTRRIAGLKRAFARYYTAFDVADFDGVDVWAGLRPCSPDGMPYLGRTASKSNLVICTGHSMIGVSLGAVSGESVARLITGERPLVDSPLLSPDRYN